MTDVVVFIFVSRMAFLLALLDRRASDSVQYHTSPQSYNCSAVSQQIEPYRCLTDESMHKDNLHLFLIGLGYRSRSITLRRTSSCTCPSRRARLGVQPSE